jgi:hypothetical protein
MRSRVVISLCSGTGAWERPFTEDPAYRVIPVDIEQGLDVHTYEPPDEEIFGVFAAPPCTAFSLSGTRWWKRHEDDGTLAKGIDTVRSCLRIIKKCKPQWWALENPVGRLAQVVPELGRWSFNFHPYEYAGWLDDPEPEAYTKRTCIWMGGRVREPERKVFHEHKGSVLVNIGEGGAGGVPRWKLRSITPQGFALAWKDMVESEPSIWTQEALWTFG